MSTISDWVADYAAGDTNTPANSTGIAYPVDGSTDLGAVLRDIKKVLRAESLNKGWWPDQRAAVRIDDDTFSCASLPNATDYPAGTPVKLIGASSTAYGWISGHPAADEVEVTPAGQITAGFGITHVVFGAILPGSDPENAADSYPAGVGSALPARLSQWGRFQISGNSTVSVQVPLAKTEPDTDYRVMIQAVDVDSGPAANGAYRIDEISKATTSFTITIDAAPGAGTTVYYEYGIFRGE